MVKKIAYLEKKLLDIKFGVKVRRRERMIPQKALPRNLAAMVIR